jgi:hypothetical protein
LINDAQKKEEKLSLDSSEAFCELQVCACLGIPHDRVVLQFAFLMITRRKKKFDLFFDISKRKDYMEVTACICNAYYVGVDLR